MVSIEDNFTGPAEGDGYGADVHIGDPARPVVFTFDTAGTAGPVRGRIGWGFDYVRRKGLNVVSFKEGDAEGWFRGAGLRALIETLDRRFDFSRFPLRIGYGGSMGGYAAASVAGLLNLDRALLCNPFSTLRPDLAPWETRYAERQRLDWTGPGFDGATEAAGVRELVVVADPLFRPDHGHALRFAAANPRTLYLRIPGVGHKMPIHMKHLGVLDACFDHVAGLASLDMADFRRRIRDRRSYTGYYAWLTSEENLRLTPGRAAVIAAAAEAAGLAPPVTT